MYQYSFFLVMSQNVLFDRFCNSNCTVQYYIAIIYGFSLLLISFDRLHRTVVELMVLSHAGGNRYFLARSDPKLE
jgi:hypothetical protein